VDAQSDPSLAFERLLGEHRDFSARLEQLAGESNKSVLALESERDQLRRAVAEAQVAAAQFEEVRTGLENRLAEQGRELADARQEIRGLLKSAESTRAAQQQERQRLEQLLADERQARRLQREQLSTELATIESLAQEAATLLRREAVEDSQAAMTPPPAAA
jgi:chromosome segregation ATPase